MRLRPGAYVDAREWLAGSERERHLLKVRAAARALTPRAVYSHESAAAVHGIPVLGGFPDVVRASYEGPNGMSRREGVRWTRACWDPGDVQQCAGLQVTSLRRTAVDIARAGSLAQGVAALDHVFAHGVEHRGVTAWARRRRPFHGVAPLVRALEVARGLSESPLESLSLARIAELGFVLPTQQHELPADGGLFRVDFFWPEASVVGEADGRVKYATADDLWREKRREDGIRRLGFAVIRWSWSDAWTVSPLRDMLDQAGVPRV
ncbi:MAG: hypothetical protein ABIR17_10355 [Pseudolysinimonas sp.]|uniref:hypothetical protein n=1 Tax=Pseudolysinimonas sp. TaxID=2680009 RepID=UPI00326655F6